MADEASLTKKEQAYVIKWAAIRQSGRMRYVITRGIIFGLLLFGLWLLVSLIEINLSEFERTLYREYPGAFFRRALIWLVCYQILGWVFARGNWKRKEEKYHYLS